MQYMTIKTQKRPRKDGRSHARAFVIRKNRKYGEVLEQTHISTKRPVLITGAHAAGKSYWLDRLRKDAARVWASRPSEPLYLAAIRPLSAWTDTKELADWWNSRDNPDDERSWSRLKAWERLDALPLYLKETKAVLFIDDAHNLSGRKLKLAQECIRAAPVWVMAAADEGRLSPGLRKDVLNAEPQTFRLGTEVAYDATNVLIWMAVAFCMTLGYWEMAFALGGLKMLGGGRRAAKQI